MIYSADFNVNADAKVKFGIVGSPWEQGGCIGPSGQRDGSIVVRKEMQLAWGYVRDNKIFDVESMRVINLNNLSVKDFGNIEDYRVDDWQYSLDKITEQVAEMVRAGYIPVFLGGDCSTHYPAFRGIHNACEGNIALIYMDAHFDFFNDHARYGSYSHGHPVGNIMKLPRVEGKHCVHFGVRNYEKPVFYDYIQEHQSTPITPQMVHRMGLEGTAKKILDTVAGADKVVLCIDIDVLDCAFAPGSAGLESGGFSTYELQEICKLLAPHVDALTLTEVNAGRDFNGMSAIAGAKLVNDFIFYKYASMCN